MEARTKKIIAGVAIGVLLYIIFKKASEPQVVVEVKSKAEGESEFRGGRGGRGGGGGRSFGSRGHGGHGRRGWYPRNRGVGYVRNGAYFVDPQGLCYTRNSLGEYVVVDCTATPSVAFGV